MSELDYESCHIARSTLRKKGQLLLSQIRHAQSAVVHQFAPTHKEAIAAYRFLNNPRITMDALHAALVDPVCPEVKGRHVLCIQDTTEINYTAHTGRLRAADQELGPITYDKDTGFFLHPSLVLDADSGLALGFGDVQIWNRSGQKQDRHERKYKRLPIEEKESYRWIKAAQQSAKQLSQAERVTLVADQEADIYSFLSRLTGVDVLVRTRGARRIEQQPGTVLALLEQQPVAGKVEVRIRGNNGRKKRKAQLEVRYCAVRVLRSESASKSDAPWLDLYAVQAIEVPESVPSGEDPIHWCLLTSHEVKTLDQALQIIGYYKARWHIEQLFRLLKKESLALEAAQLTSGSALKKLCMFSLQVALVQLQLVGARDGAGQEKASLTWSEQALGLMLLMQGQLEGNTKKLQCPHPVGTLAWTSWIIARLGGWKGYNSQSPPGPITMKRGLERFASQFAGWQLAINNR